MKLIPTQIGAEPKKLAVLGGLAVVLVYFFVSNRGSDDSSAPSRSQPSQAGPSLAAPPVRSAVRTGPRRTTTLNRNLQEFRPSLKPKDVDRSTIDPTLHLDLLAKLQDVKVEGASRSLFEFSKEPPPQEVAAVKEPDPIHVFKPYGPPAPPKPEPPPAPPKAPPIPLKFYGFINPNKTVGPRRAFFLDGDEIIVASEGQMIKNRYKIVRIGINSAVVEDTQFKDSQQTLPLETEQAG